MFCSICLEILEQNSMKSLECSHSFHTYCINEWISYNTNSYQCPICRKEYYITNQVIIDIQENIEPIIQENIDANYKVVEYTILLLVFYILIVGGNTIYTNKYKYKIN